MAEKIKISGLLNHYAPHVVVTNSRAPAEPPEHQWGYTMGGDGRVATLDYLTRRAKSSYPNTWQSYLGRTKKWLGRPVQDCNAVAEAYYKRMTGVDINTKARLNYANWCDPKSPAAANTRLIGLPQMPGVAVFSGSRATDISHVGFLLQKYGPGPLDWYVLEARGADYGLVVTRLPDRGWAWWGVMSKYFAYDAGENWRPDSVSRQPFYAVCSGQGVNVRTGRGTGNDSLGKADKGALLLALPAVSDWCEVAVSLDGGIAKGYMHSAYVQRV